MNQFHRNSRVSFFLFSVVLLGAAYAAQGSDTNFPGNVSVTSNLVVRGSVSVTNDVMIISNVFVDGSIMVTNITPGVYGASLYLSGADTDGNNCDGGGVVIVGGQGWNYSGDGFGGGNVTVTGGSIVDYLPGSQVLAGSVIIQGGQGHYYGDYAGDVILKNSSGGYISGLVSGSVKLQDTNGVTRFYLQQDGSLNANSDAIINLGALQLGGTTITSWTKAGVQPGGSTSLTLTNGTVINGASFASITALSAPTISNVNVLTATTISNAVSVTSNVVVKALTVQNYNKSSATIEGNLAVNGSLDVTYIKPNQINSSLFISVADSGSDDGPGLLTITGGTCYDGSSDGGNVRITGGLGGGFSGGGTVTLQGGYAYGEGSAGRVILMNGAPTTGFVTLQTYDGTTRFHLQGDGTLNANNSAIIGVGAVQLGGSTITNWIQVVSHVGPLGGVSMGSFTNAP